ncbi:hypothetical protein [Aureimonas pseudogalii]|uniref:Uncharacterized protein n=1 Tax=Aureimonas pseudogalii TaxID=1744844 RepID=A0A7W6H7P8_9HYPH|nr:hypothetical protein [Aureimonas pseudogalii]MBB4000096.1 hypothetical protein [Aureimonas pseudogalii]
MSENANQGRRSLDMDLGAFDRPDVSPAKAPSSSDEQRRRVNQVSQFPSREPDAKGDQINLKLSSEEKARFKRMAKKERYNHGEFLTVLMDAYEKSQS